MIGRMSDEPDAQPQRAPDGTSRRPPRPEKLLAIIRFLAPHSEKVVFSVHAQERLIERDIPDAEVFRALRHGYIKGDIRPGKNDGEWVCKAAYRVRGSREIGVATVVIRGEKLW